MCAIPQLVSASASPIPIVDQTGTFAVNAWQISWKLRGRALCFVCRNPNLPQTRLYSREAVSGADPGLVRVVRSNPLN